MKSVVITLAATLAAASCAVSAPGPAAPLVGGEWVVEDINGGGVIDNSRASLTFGDDSRVSGRGSCNNYSAEYTLTGEGLSFSRAAATLRACAPALMDQERKFFDTLAKVSRFSINETGALILTTPEGGKILARRKLRSLQPF